MGKGSVPDERSWRLRGLLEIPASSQGFSQLGEDGETSPQGNGSSGKEDPQVSVFDHKLKSRPKKRCRFGPRARQTRLVQSRTTRTYRVEELTVGCETTSFCGQE